MTQLFGLCFLLGQMLRGKPREENVEEISLRKKVKLEGMCDKTSSPGD